MRLLKSNPLSAFCRHVSHKLDNSQRIPSTQSANGTVLTTDIDKVNAFNEYFTSFFTQPICSSDKFNINKTCASEEINFSQQAVFEV